MCLFGLRISRVSPQASQRLPTLSRTFIVGFICLTKNKICVFHPVGGGGGGGGGVYPIFIHPKTRNLLLLLLLLLLFYTTVSFDFGRCPIFELITHSLRMVNNSTMQLHLTRLDVTVHMKCNHATCIIRATCNIYKYRIIIFLTYNFHLSQFSC